MTLSQAPTPVTYLSVHVNEIEYSEIENRVPLNCIAVTFNAMNNNTCRPCRRTHQPSVRDRAGKLVSTCDARLKLDSCPGQQKSSQGGGRHERGPRRSLSWQGWKRRELAWGWACLAYLKRCKCDLCEGRVQRQQDVERMKPLTSSPLPRTEFERKRHVRKSDMRKNRNCLQVEMYYYI